MDAKRIAELRAKLDEHGDIGYGDALELLDEVEREHKLIIRYMRDRHRLKAWTQSECDCGGAGPGEGCSACDAYHAGGLGWRDA